MKKGDLVKFRHASPHGLQKVVYFGIILSEFDDGYNVVWQVDRRFSEPKWYSFRDLVPLTLDSSKDLLSKAL